MYSVSLDAPITLLETYGCHYVNFYLTTSSSTISQAQQPPNALEILMKNAEQLVLPPAAIDDSSSGSEQHIRGDNRLRKDFIHYLETVCFYCGMAEGFVTESIVELQRQYAVVRPLCFLCQSDGKTHKFGRPNNVVTNSFVASGV